MKFQISQKRQRIDIAFSATLVNVDRAADTTKSFLIDAGLEKQVFGILLGLREALNNAVLKGSQQNRHKTVLYHIEHQRDRLILKVEDEGEGFDWRRHLGKQLMPTEETGKGVPILERYFETIWFNEKGNKLVLVKLL
jgi:anti-sigma regulatory factor (Ser/Thr protein kinase)